ncbi:MAG: hypothetical protein HQL95_16555, partial [Magnetococcales bacterium]|nr:hypothetical protein [Magnetococcales bacterium]
MDTFRFVRLPLVIFALVLLLPASVHALPVNITKDLAQFTVKHGNKSIKVMRNQDTRAVIEPDFAKISRNCPPFCIQPIEAAPGVKGFLFPKRGV